MKQKIIIIFMSAALALGGIACGGNKTQVISTESNTKNTDSETQSPSESSSQAEKSTEHKISDVYFKDDTLKINDATIKIKEIKVQEPNTDFGETNPTLIILYDFTNNKSEVLAPDTVWFACFNAQQETDVAFEDLDISTSPLGDEYASVNSMRNADIKPGATVESVMSYQIKYPNSQVILKATQGLAGKELGNKIIDLEKYKSKEVETELNKEEDIKNIESETEKKDQESSEIVSSKNDTSEIADEHSQKKSDDKVKENLISLGYSALIGDGSGYATETFNDFTYSVPDTWFKLIKDNYVIYKTDYGFIMFYSNSNDNIEDPVFLDMLVDGAINGSKKQKNYVEISKEESKIGNCKSVKLHYTCDINGNDTTEYVMAFIDSSNTTILITYSVDTTDSQEEITNGTIDNVFNSVKLLH